jgi:hypothetical protein
VVQSAVHDGLEVQAEQELTLQLSRHWINSIWYSAFFCMHDAD